MRHAADCDCYRCFDARNARYLRWSKRLETICWAIITALVLFFCAVIDRLDSAPPYPQQALPQQDEGEYDGPNDRSDDPQGAH